MELCEKLNRFCGSILCEVGGLHLIDGLDEVEEGFGALSFVGDFGGGVIGGV